MQGRDEEGKACMMSAEGEDVQPRESGRYVAMDVWTCGRRGRLRTKRTRRARACAACSSDISDSSCQPGPLLFVRVRMRLWK